MKVVIPGGTGQVGAILARALHAAGHEVVILSRRPTIAPWRIVPWDARSVGAWAAELERADAVINLAGRSVNCRYTVTNRRAILESRVQSTRAVGAAIAQAQHPPRVWLQMSTATIYSHRYDAPNDEASGIIGGAEQGAPDTWRFSIDVAKAWEAAAGEQETPATRKVLLRTAMVMSPDRGGVFDTLLRLVRVGLGGAAAGGRQYVSWIHHVDFVRAVLWLIDHIETAGAVNLAAPHPLPNRAFMAALRTAWGASVGLPATSWMLEVGAFAMRTETELVLKSRRVVPGRLVNAGFVFEHPAWPAAARALCDEWHARATSTAPAA
ncbi:MAG TPA: TIGR01777 family oxidoreductase [Gemmatimonadaceae bacterium]|nr:TIGR01777 family oxidoreductase [Gemmatimonadaceae bacterium]